MVETAKDFKVDPIPVVLDCNCFVAILDGHLVKSILLDELKEGLVAKHLSHLQLMLVPVLLEAFLYIAFGHVKGRPVDLGASMANEGAISHVEVCALILAALHAVGIKRILGKQIPDELRLLGGLALHDRGRRRGSRSLNEGEERVWWELSEWLLGRIGKPGWLLVWTQFHRICSLRECLGLGQLLVWVLHHAWLLLHWLGGHG